MTKKEIREIVKAITYKEGWVFQCRDSMFDAVEVRVGVKVKDVEAPDKEIVLNQAMLVHEGMEKERVLMCVCQLVRELEIHEMDEWLKFEGQRINNPHPLTPSVL